MVWIKRALTGIVGIVGVTLLAAVGATLYALAAYKKTWDVPLPDIHAVSDTAVIARGRYLVNGPMHCADCHVPDSARPRMFRGEEVPLTGGPGEHTFLGTWSAPNLTPDSATGLGRVSDGQLARMMRYGVNRSNRIGLPFMDANADLSEEDLVAMISYLRSLPPTPGMPPRPQINLLGKLTLAYFLKPYAPKAPPPAAMPPDTSVHYGDYLANTVCGCRSCHTARNLKTGDFESPFFSGGLLFKSRVKPGYVYSSPNLTPDSATSGTYSWTEEIFVQRIHAGLLIQDSPMPWGSLKRMHDDDIRALYHYLRSLAPVRHAVGPVLQPRNGRDAAGG